MSNETNTPDFEGSVATEAADSNADDLDLEVNDDTNLDVDVPSNTDDEVEDTSASDASAGPKAAAAAKTPRTKAPEGFVKPVEFAKILSEHLSKTVPPQVVYSYIKNNQGEGAKHPFPTHEVDGYAWYIKPEEGLDWWDTKNSRVASGKAARAEKAAAKATKEAAPAEAESNEPVVEAE